MTTLFQDGSLQHPMYMPNEGLEALRQQLFYTYMELDHTRKASAMQAKLTDAKLQQLQAMLIATVKERDRAFQECKKLRRCLLRLSNEPVQPIQNKYPTTASICSRMNDSIKQLQIKVSEVHDTQSEHTLAIAKHPTNTQHTQPNMLNFEHSQDNHLTMNTLEQDGLTIFDDDNNSWQMDMSFHNSKEQFCMDISRAFDELDTLDLPELKEEKNLVSQWEADLGMVRPSSVDPTRASQLLSEGNAKKGGQHVRNNQTTGSSTTDNTTDIKAISLFGDPYAIGSQSPLASMRNVTPSSASSTLFAQTPITIMSKQECASPSRTSGSQSASASVYMSTPLSTLNNVSPSMPSVFATQSAMPSASMFNHLPKSVKPTISSLSMSAPQSTPMTLSAHSPARIPNCFSTPAKLGCAITSTLAPTHSAMATPEQMTQSAPMLTHPCSSMIQEAFKSAPIASSQNTDCIFPITNSQSKPTLSTSLLHSSIFLPKQTLPRTNQIPTLTLPRKRCHLPEPPEANMDTMLSSLPKKGKLLEAVLQAGPLLQQLILAGPLPQWQRPRPQLNTENIPRVPTSPNSVLSPFSHAQYSSSCMYPSQFPFTSTL